MMLSASWSKLSRTSRSFTVEETPRFTWRLPATNLQRKLKERKPWPSKAMPAHSDNCPLLSQKTQDSMPTSSSTTSKSKSKNDQMPESTSILVWSTQWKNSPSPYLFNNLGMPPIQRASTDLSQRGGRDDHESRRHHHLCS